MRDDVLIRAEGVSKKFCRSLKRSLWYGVKDSIADLTGRGSETNELRADEFWAVNDVSFELRRGECLGLIGHNGAGKTTLLKMLNGLIKPDHGRIEIRGRMGALIALGAGFNPVLTGRENIYVNGAVLGLSRDEINHKFDEIVDFADVGDFLDAPVQSYSSGMQVRLGFAVATAIEPDVLLLDEILAVGDAAFRNKCYRKIASLRKRAAVIFVSHAMDQVGRVCTHGLTLSNGQAIKNGPVGEAISAYDELSRASDDGDEAFLSLQSPIKMFDATLLSNEVGSGSPLTIDIDIASREALNNVFFKLFFFNAAGAYSAEANCSPAQFGASIPEGKSRWRLSLSSLPLRSGTYRISFHLIDSYYDFLVWSYKRHELQVTNTPVGAFSDCQLQVSGWTEIVPSGSSIQSLPDDSLASRF
jgi:lipopolysaccharide transport system ATP-binding protein